MFFSFVAMYSGLGPYLTTSYGLNANELFLVRLAGAPGILLSPISGKFAQRWGSKRVALGGLTLAIFGLFLELVTRPLPLLVIATVVFVTGIAMTSPSLIALVSTIADDVKGSGQAIHSFVLFTGASFAPLIVQSSTGQIPRPLGREKGAIRSAGTGAQSTSSYLVCLQRGS